MIPGMLNCSSYPEIQFSSINFKVYDLINQKSEEAYPIQKASSVSGIGSPAIHPGRQS